MRFLAGTSGLAALVASLALVAGPAAAGHTAAPVPTWMTKASIQLAAQWFPGPKPASVSFSFGKKTSKVTIRFRRPVTCNCPAPPGASVSGRRAVFTLDTHTRQMKTFQVYKR